jgi:flagellin-like protein
MSQSYIATLIFKRTISILVLPFNNRSVSPVVGLILVVLITVALAVVIVKLSNVYFQPAPNVLLDVRVYTVEKANATKIYIEDLGGDPIYFKNKRVFIFINGHRFEFHPFTQRGFLQAGDKGVLIVPLATKVGEEVTIQLAIGGMTIFSGESASVFFSKKVTVQKAKIEDLEEGLLAEWHFEHKYPDEASFIDANPTRFYDLSGNGNHLIYGAYDWFDSDRMWVEGVNGYALNFSPHGSAYGAFYSVDHITGRINLTQSLTYEAWIRPRDFLDLRTVITDGAWWRWIFVSKDGWWGGSRRVVACFCFNGDNTPGTEKYIVSKTELEENRWYHVAVTYDGKYVKIYINGKLDKSEYHPGYITPPPELSAVQIGSQWGSYSFSGLIDEVYIWNRALTPQEIKERFEIYADRIR